MGSEMCIRDRPYAARQLKRWGGQWEQSKTRECPDLDDLTRRLIACLLYTSDAADERSSVDLGGCRIIKKKNEASVAYSVHMNKRRNQEHYDRRHNDSTTVNTIALT